MRFCSQSTKQVRLRVFPSTRGFFDEPVQLKVDRLFPHQCVELRSKLVDDSGNVFKASAMYVADPSGRVDVCSSTCLGGSYNGVEPMGLYWSMAPETPHKKMKKKTVLSPMLVHIDVISGETGEVLATQTNERMLLMEGVKRIPLQNTKIKGVLFLPPGDGPFPGVLDLYTLGGGMNEIRASLLAKRGFVVLALAYYGYDDLPQTPKHFDLEYFEEAINFVRGHPQVQGPGIGIVSISKSGDLALSMSAFLSGISALVCINGCNANVLYPLHYKYTVIPPLLPVTKNLRVTASGILDVKNLLPDPALEENRDSVIPIERSSCQFLFAVSEDDRNWNSSLFAEQAASRLRDHEKHTFEVVTYPKAGHFLEVPYTPHCPSAFHAAVRNVVVFGGEPKAHSEAELDLWERIEKFLRKHLNCNGKQIKSQL
ncbi:acyl-coenzyme A thioesterase 1-like [Aplochiton taeniatus]